MPQILDFKGEMPRITARLLTPNAAQRAVDVRLDDGTITPIARRKFVSDLETARKTIYLRGDVFLAWSDVVHAVPGPTATDRLYISGDGKPKLMVDDKTFDLAVPGPSEPPAAEPLTGPDPAADSYADIVYAYTFVTEYDEESAPSPGTQPFGWSDGPVRLTFEDPPGERGIDRIRIYRSQTSISGVTELFYAEEVPVTDSHDADVSLTGLSDPINVSHYTAPPNNLRGFTVMPNGMIAGFRGREIWFCEPYIPHAWPSSYSLVVDYEIVGLAAFGSHLAVMTRGTPYRVQGSHPENVQLEKIEENLPCESARSIVDLGYAAAYASPEGLVLISPSGAQVVSKPVFTRRQWRMLDPASIVAGRFSDRYVFTFSGSLTGFNERAVMVDLSGQEPFVIRLSDAPRAYYHDIRTGTLYYQAGDNQLYSFDDPTSDDHQVAVWRSKLLDMPYPVNFGAIQIEGEELISDSGFEARVYADGNLTTTVRRLNDVARLASGFTADEWEVEVRGKVSIDSIAIARTPAGLADQR